MNKYKISIVKIKNDYKEFYTLKINRVFMIMFNNIEYYPWKYLWWFYLWYGEGCLKRSKVMLNGKRWPTVPLYGRWKRIYWDTVWQQWNDLYWFASFSTSFFSISETPLQLIWWSGSRRCSLLDRRRSALSECLSYAPSSWCSSFCVYP